MSIARTKVGPHAGRARNALTFEEAYAQATNAPARHYTTGRVSFTVLATVVRNGDRVGERVLRFMIGGNKERARVYRCCWDKRTNCINQHIHAYTEAMVAFVHPTPPKWAIADEEFPKSATGQETSGIESARKT
jgi:hypothetical protein